MTSKKLLAMAAFALGVQVVSAAPTFVNVSNSITSPQTWTRDKVYILTNTIFVRNNAVLTIEPGTIIRGANAGAGNNGSQIANIPGALIVARGAKIIANGTADDPIIFTTLDDTNVPGGAGTVPTSFTSKGGAPVSVTAANYSPTGPQDNNGFTQVGKWGGIAIMGNAYASQGTNIYLPSLITAGQLSIGTTTNDVDGTLPDCRGQDYLEGIDNTKLTAPNGFDPVNDLNSTVYGGVSDTDNSGVLRFVSIRYAGFNLAAANELNGLTLCGVGSGTIIEFVESSSGLDDGFEWFGGTHNARFLSQSFCGDDAFDGDEGFRGNLQFLFNISSNENTEARDIDGTVTSPFSTSTSVGGSSYAPDEILEWDGPEPDNLDGLPLTLVDFYNLTAVGPTPASRGIDAKLETNIGVFNSYVDYNAVFGRVAAGSTLRGNHIHHYSDGATDRTGTAWTGLSSYVNLVSRGLNTTPKGFTKNSVDLRAKSGATHIGITGTTIPSGNLMVSAGNTFAGAAVDNNWLAGWSHLAALTIVNPANIARPVLTLGASGSNPTVSFPANIGIGGRTVTYVIERSSDQVTWTQATIISDGGVGDTAGAGTIGYTDTGASLAAPVYYRVFAL